MKNAVAYPRRPQTPQIPAPITLQRRVIPAMLNRIVVKNHPQNGENIELVNTELLNTEMLKARGATATRARDELKPLLTMYRRD